MSLFEGQNDDQPVSRTTFDPTYEHNAAKLETPDDVGVLLAYLRERVGADLEACDPMGRLSRDHILAHLGPIKGAQMPKTYWERPLQIVCNRTEETENAFVVLADVIEMGDLREYKNPLQMYAAFRNRLEVICNAVVPSFAWQGAYPDGRLPDDVFKLERQGQVDWIHTRNFGKGKHVLEAPHDANDWTVPSAGLDSLRSIMRRCAKQRFTYLMPPIGHPWEAQWLTREKDATPGMTKQKSMDRTVHVLWNLLTPDSNKETGKPFLTIQNNQPPANFGKLMGVRLTKEDEHPTTRSEKAKRFYDLVESIIKEGAIKDIRVHTWGDHPEDEAYAAVHIPQNLKNGFVSTPHGGRLMSDELYTLCMPLEGVGQCGKHHKLGIFITTDSFDLPSIPYDKSQLKLGVSNNSVADDDIAKFERMIDGHFKVFGNAVVRITTPNTTRRAEGFPDKWITSLNGTIHFAPVSQHHVGYLYYQTLLKVLGTGTVPCSEYLFARRHLIDHIFGCRLFDTMRKSREPISKGFHPVNRLWITNNNQFKDRFAEFGLKECAEMSVEIKVPPEVDPIEHLAKQSDAFCDKYPFVVMTDHQSESGYVTLTAFKYSDKAIEEYNAKDAPR